MRGWRQALGGAQGGVGRRQDLDLQGVVAPGVQVQHFKQQPHLLVQLRKVRQQRTSWRQAEGGKNVGTGSGLGTMFGFAYVMV